MQAELKLLVNFSEGESRCYDREITAVASLMQFTQVLQQIYYVWTLKYTWPYTDTLSSDFLLLS